jgi:hypothetical protein
MSLFSLLHLALKSDEVIELIEHYQLNVVYDFDRLHENTPDVYRASSPQAGFELKFDERQVLSTIFMYVRPRGKFSAILPSIAGVPFYRTFAEVSAEFTDNNISFRTSAEGQGWIKGNFGTHQVHYEFNREGALSLVTVMAADA